MDLYLFPAPADDYGGYDIAVKDAYLKLSPKDNDVVVWANLFERPHCAKDGDYVVFYKPFKSFHTIFKLLSGFLNYEFSEKDLEFLKDKEFDNIHCDDIVFYRAIRKLYPDKKISLRFHNVFSRIYDRCFMLNINAGWRLYGKMFLSRYLERRIFNDRNVFKYFLTKEDADYYHLITGAKDYQVWNMSIIKHTKVYEHIQHIVWYGGIEGHKQSSVEWFIRDVWPSIFEKRTDIDFHLYGKFSEGYNNPTMRIYGHGRYDGNDMPFVTSGLFINPDLMGGGIKIKIKTYLESGVRFLSTPFGFEGYDNSCIDNNQCYVVPIHDWKDFLLRILK